MSEPSRALIHHYWPGMPVLRQLALGSILVLAAGAGWGQNRAAQVMAVTGSVTAIDGQGRERVLEKGGDVRAGDRVVTGEGALVQMRMNDGGYISVRSATEMAIERFTFDDKEAANSNMLLSLIKGGFRSITGLIGRTNPGAYSIRAGTATVGIRGTDHEPMLVLPGALGGAAAGLYDKVNDGETFIRTERGQLALLKGQVGFAPTVPDRPPQTLSVVPDFYKIEVKTDARDPKDATTTSRAGEGEKAADTGLLRPSVAARREALKEAAKDGTASVEVKSLSTTTLGTATTLGTTSTLGTTTTLKSTLTEAVVSPLTTDKTTSTLLTSPTTITTLKDAAVLTTTTPTLDKTLSTTLTSPTLSTSTLTSPTLSTSTLSTTTKTLTSPTLTTTTVSPTLSTSTLSTTILAPATTTTTTVAPTTSTVKSTTLIAPTTTTIKSTITK